MLKKRTYDFDLIVIGSGAGGSVGAHYAASIGKKVAIFEADAIGGECPNFACVPTKALLHAAGLYERMKAARFFGITAKDISIDYPHIRKWKDLVVERTGAAHGAASFKRDGLTVISEKAFFVSPHEVEAGGKKYSAAKFLLATGSKVFIPPVPGLVEAGYITFKQAVDFTHLPSSLLISGGGVVGCELASVFASLGGHVH